jgi:hypothetical protein
VPLGIELGANGFRRNNPLGLDRNKSFCVGCTPFTKVQEQPSKKPSLFHIMKKLSFGFSRERLDRESKEEVKE